MEGCRLSKRSRTGDWSDVLCTGDAKATKAAGKRRDLDMTWSKANATRADDVLQGLVNTLVETRDPLGEQLGRHSAKRVNKLRRPATVPQEEKRDAGHRHQANAP